MNAITSFQDYLTHLANANTTFFYLYDKRDNFSNSGKTLLDEFVKSYTGADFCSIETSEHPDVATKLQIYGSPAIFFTKGGRKDPTVRFAASNPQIILFKVSSEFSRRGITKI